MHEKRNSKGVRLAVVGSRGWSDRARLFAVLDDRSPLAVVSGGAGGADTLAEEWARSRGVPCTVIRPDYAKHGRGAPLIRNKTIVESADAVLAFWDGKSRGTLNAIDHARKAGKDVEIVSI